MLNDLLDGPLALRVTIKKSVLRQRQQERSCRLKFRLQVIEDQSVVRQQFNVSLDVWDVLVVVRFFDSSHCSLARRRQAVARIQYFVSAAFVYPMRALPLVDVYQDANITAHWRCRCCSHCALACLGVRLSERRLCSHQQGAKSSPLKE